MNTRCVLAAIGLSALLLPCGCTTDSAPPPKLEPVTAAREEFPLPEHVYAFEEVEVLPKPVSQVAPVYPAGPGFEAANPGRVHLRFVVLADGQVTNVRVITSTHKAFERPALEAVRQWRYQPAVKDGQPVACMIDQAIAFSIEE